MAEQFLRLRVLEDEVAHARVPAVQRAQRLHEVRIGKEAHIEDQIRVVGGAVLEAEGHQGRREPGPGALRAVQLDEQLLELVHRQGRRVQHPVGHLAHV